MRIKILLQLVHCWCCLSDSCLWSIPVQCPWLSFNVFTFYWGKLKKWEAVDWKPANTKHRLGESCGGKLLFHHRHHFHRKWIKLSKRRSTFECMHLLSNPYMGKSFESFHIWANHLKWPSTSLLWNCFQTSSSQERENPPLCPCSLPLGGRCQTLGKTPPERDRNCSSVNKIYVMNDIWS